VPVARVDEVDEVDEVDRVNEVEGSPSYFSLPGSVSRARCYLSRADYGVLSG
jgi:hypothetical protein